MNKKEEGYKVRVEGGGEKRERERERERGRERNVELYLSP